MTQFIEVHLFGSKNQQPLMLNTDCIAYVKPYETGSLIYLSLVDIRGQQGDMNSSEVTLGVTESYYTLKENLHCK